MTRALGLGVIALLLVRADALAQTPCIAEPAPIVSPAAWASPLDRSITLHAGTVPLREALARITSAGRLRVSYSRELVPLDRPTCLEFTAAPVGEVLARVLRGTAVSAMVAGRDHVVLGAARTDPSSGSVDELGELVVLDGIRVNAEGAPAARAAGVVSTSIDGRALERQGASSLAEAMDGLVPGVWVWASGSGSALTQYGSLRGASSFGLSAPKLYIDGLEVANPLLISSLDPATIERVEVVRGPQGAAAFGADAIAGVTHIITRQGLDAGGARATLRTAVGVAGSAYSPDPTLEQDHGLGIATGSPDRSARLDLSFSSLGAYVPEADARRLSAVGSARTIGDRFALTATARFLSESSALIESPLLQATSAAPAAGENRDIAVGQYTAGVTAAFRPSERWSHTVVAGINGYSIAGAPTLMEAGSAADSALAAAGSSAFRTTLRITSVNRLASGPRAAGAFTLSAEHSALHQQGGIAIAPYWEPLGSAGRGNPLMRPSVTGGAAGTYAAGELARERGTTGVSGRFDATLLDRVHLSTGLRYEHTSLEDRSTAAALLPSLGASWTAFARGQLAVSLRAAYGRGVRWPQAPALNGFGRPLQLSPEEQSGIEAGVDVALGQAFSLQATRFDQLASGLTQQVASTRDSTARHATYTALVAQNVGTIANHGWEFAAVARHGALTLSGTLALVDSRVQDLASGYTGDLTAGDRMLAVPARTASINALWTQPNWSASLSLSRAADWLNYDRIALARADSTLTTAQLRAYWLHYDGTTRLRASLSRDLGARLSLRLTGENLLDIQTGEPDNATIVPGRTLSLTLRARL